MLRRLSWATCAILALSGQGICLDNFVEIAEQVWRRQVGLSFVQQQDMLLKQAREENKYIFVACLGQSWCPWSKKIAEEVLAQREFLQGIEEMAVLGCVDFPENFSDERQEVFSDLVKKYDLKELPTFLILSSDGEVVAKMGYLPLSAHDFTLHVKRLLEDHQKVVQALARSEKLGAKGWETIYLMAKTLGCEKTTEEVLQKASKEEESSFFLMEKYMVLVQDGKKHSRECRDLRKKIIAIDPNNLQGSHLRLAHIDFENLRRNLKKKDDVKKVIAPLARYVKEFGKKDQANLWQIELMMAQFLFSKDQIQDALLHALASYEAAPKEKKNEITDLIGYIRNHLPENFSLESAKK